MLASCAIVLFVMLIPEAENWDVPVGAAKADATAELKAQCAKVAAATTYAFESVVDSDAPNAGGAPRDNTPAMGRVEIGKFAELKHADVVTYRRGEKLVYKKKDAWEIFNPSDAGAGGGGGRGGKYGGGGGGGGGSEAREHQVLKNLATMVLPHDFLATVDTKIKDVKLSEADGKRTFIGTLTDAAALDLSGAKDIKEPSPGHGGAKDASTPYKASGTATVVFGKDGNAERLVIETKAKNAQSEFKTKRTITLRDWGATKVDVPKDAASKLSG